jgi:glycosyltransferase involved in cell wall biosynthesis
LPSVASPSLEVSRDRVRVARVIARMNVGGPAYHVSLLCGRMDPERFESLLLTGSVGPGEASFEALAGRYGAPIRRVSGLGPEIAPLRDLRALISLRRQLADFRPHVVHTHTAKAGLLGRLAALTLRPRPVIVHTYHGHVLRGYFGQATSEAFRLAERALGAVSDRLVAVSARVAEELIELRVAPRERFCVIPVGLELERFVAVERESGRAFRTEIGVRDAEVLAVFVGRLVPIKRVDLLLEAVARARAAGAPLRLAVVGDGKLRGELEAAAKRLGIACVTRFLGYRDDLPQIAAATDIAVLTSDNEGTPVSLIEAAAAGRPAVATDVGGVRDIVTASTGRLAPPADVGAFATALTELAASESLRTTLGEAARVHVRSRFASERLLREVATLYNELLASANTPDLVRNLRLGRRAGPGDDD